MCILNIEVTRQWALALINSGIIVDQVIVDGTGKCDDSIVINDTVKVSIAQDGSAHVVISGATDDEQPFWDFGKSWSEPELQNLIAEIRSKLND